MILEMVPDCEITSIDYKDQKVTRPPELGPPDPRINFIVENSKTVRPPGLVRKRGPRLRRRRPPPEGIVNDTRLAMSLVAPGGLIIWHDVLDPGRRAGQGEGPAKQAQVLRQRVPLQGLSLKVYRVVGTVLGLHHFGATRSGRLGRLELRRPWTGRRTRPCIRWQSLQRLHCLFEAVELRRRHPRCHRARASASRSAREASDIRYSPMPSSRFVAAPVGATALRAATIADGEGSSAVTRGTGPAASSSTRRSSGDSAASRVVSSDRCCLGRANASRTTRKNEA